METILIISVVIMVASNFGKYWLVAKGSLRPVYWLMILSGIAGTVANITLASNDPKQVVVLLINLTTLFMIVMGIKGLFRLRKENESSLP